MVPFVLKGGGGPSVLRFRLGALATRKLALRALTASFKERLRSKVVTGRVGARRVRACLRAKVFLL